MKVWPIQDAEARLDQLVDASIANGPQMLTRHGIETAVLVPIEEWRRMNADQPRKTLKDLLLADEPKFDLDIPPRGQWRHREPPTFDD